MSDWTERTCAIGIFAKSGRYNSRTFAHRDIAFEFGSWISPSFILLFIKEFQRLKTVEAELHWEKLNAEFIKMNLPKKDRLARLNEIAIYQMQLMMNIPSLNLLKTNDDKGKLS